MGCSPPPALAAVVAGIPLSQPLDQLWTWPLAKAMTQPAKNSPVLEAVTASRGAGFTAGYPRAHPSFELLDVPDPADCKSFG